MEIRGIYVRILLTMTTMVVIYALPITQNTTYDESLTASDVKRDFDTVLNGTEPSTSAMLLFRYPSFLNIVAKIVNDISLSNSSSLSEYELCQLVKENLQKSKDECEKPYSSTAVKVKCENSTKVPSSSNSTKPTNSSFYDICQQFILTTTRPVATTAPFLFRRMRRLVQYPLIYGASSRRKARHVKYSSNSNATSNIKGNNTK